jgi:hypothetical protein
MYSIDIKVFQPLATFRIRGRRGHDRMVVGFKTPYTISAYHHSIRAKCTTLCDKKFVSDMRHLSGFV